MVFPNTYYTGVVIYPPIPRPESTVESLSMELSVGLGTLEIASKLPNPYHSMFGGGSRVGFASGPEVMLLSLFVVMVCWACARDVTVLPIWLGGGVVMV